MPVSLYGPAYYGAHVPARSRLSGGARQVAGGGLHNISSNAGGTTFNETITIEGDFDYVRLIYMNDQTASYTIGPVSVAACSKPSMDGVGAGGVFPTFVKASFGSGGAKQDIAAQLQGPTPTATTLTVAGALSANTWSPSLSYSDWIPVSSIPREDGGVGRLLQVRTCIPAQSNNARGLLFTGSGANPSPVTGRDYLYGYNSGDLASSPAQGQFATFSSFIAGTGAPAMVYGVQYMSRTPQVTVLGIGDSVIAGFGGAIDYLGYAGIACSRVSTLARPVNYVQASVYGEPSANFFQSGMNDIAAFQPDIVLIQTWSGNDVNQAITVPQAQAAADASWRRSLVLADTVRAYGGTPVLITPAPVGAPTQALDAVRMSVTTRCLAAAQSGMAVFDANAVFSNGASPSFFKPGWSSDGYHPNAAAQDAAASVLASIISKLLQK